jgi:hypothetical protein
MFAPIYTGFQLSFYGLTGTKEIKAQGQAKGSSKYKLEGGELAEKKKRVKNGERTKVYQKRQCKAERKYKLNKSLVKKKIFAFYHLPKKAQYFRLWTLTYPAGTEDKIAYKIQNNFLTRLRSELRLQDYIWIAERQKNNTIHFHFIFAQYIDITKANNYAKKSINNAIEKGEIIANKSQYFDYNGLDVSKKVGDFNTVAKYLTKYVTKNNTESTRLPYYCSTSISRLFTTLILSAEEIERIINIGQIKISKKEIFESDYFAFWAVEKIKISEVFSGLFAVNEEIYNKRK